MMFNKFSNYLYQNSLFLQNIDKFILPFILITLFTSTFMNSDAIGFFAIIVIFLTIVKILTNPKQEYKLNSFEMWLVIYFMIVFVSLCGSTLFAQSLKGFFKTFVYIGYYFSVAKYLKDNTKHIPYLLATIIFCTFSEAIVGLFQSTLHLEQISTWQDTSNLNPEDVISRVYGTLKPYNPNLYGGYLVCGLPAILGSIFYFLNNKSIKYVICSIIASFITIYSIFQTGCRGAYLALILILGLTFLISAKFFWNTYKKWYISFVSTATLLFLLTLTFVNSLRLRFLSIFAMRKDSSNSFRFNVYHSSIEMFKDNWLLGIGVGNKNFREIYGLYMKTGFDALSSYNIYLETAVESGIFALIAFLGFLLTICYKCIKYIFSSENYERIIYISVCIVAILAIMLHGMVDTIYFRPQLQFMFWIYIAVVTSILKNDK